MFASLQRTRHDSVHRPVRERPRNQRHARPGMNEHEHRHTAEGTRDDVKPNASREEHFLRLLVTAGTEFLVRGDEVSTRQIADRDHLKVGQTMLGRHGDKPTLIPQFVKLERSEEHTSELQSLMRTSYAVFCLKKKQIT